MSTTLKAEQKRRVSQAVDQLIDGLNLDKPFDTTKFLENPKSGYSEIKAFVEKMINTGHSDIDILVSVGEQFDRDLSQRVLSDLRNRGIF